MNIHNIDIELPAEFRSGNSVPVTVATIKRERMEEILINSIEADRQRRGEPVAWRCEDCPPVGYSTDVTRCEPCDRRSAPQPAEPVKVPSYDAEVQAFIACDGMGAVIVEGPRYAAVVRALLASYANTSKSSEEIDTSAESVDGVGIIETPEES